VPLPADAAANLCIGSMVNHTTILILGGYAVSAAFSRCEIELHVAAFLQRHLGHKYDVSLKDRIDEACYQPPLSVIGVCLSVSMTGQNCSC